MTLLVFKHLTLQTGAILAAYLCCCTWKFKTLIFCTSYSTLNYIKIFVKSYKNWLIYMTDLKKTQWQGLDFRNLSSMLSSTVPHSQEGNKCLMSTKMNFKKQVFSIYLYILYIRIYYTLYAYYHIHYIYSICYYISISLYIVMYLATWK